MPEWLANGIGDDFAFWIGYFTNAKHLAWISSVQFNLFAAIMGAMVALGLGLAGAALKNAPFAPARLLATAYINLVRGVPDVLFFLFFPLAFEQAMEWIIASRICPPEEVALRAGQWPPCNAANLHFGTVEYLVLASVSLGIIYGASTANVVSGAMNAVGKGQLEAARAFGLSRLQVLWRIHVRQMWIYALPGLSNVWLLLIKSTSLLSLLQIFDVVRWSDRLGAPNFSRVAGLVHPDWRWGYYLAILIFYIGLTFVSEKVFAALTRWAGRGVPRSRGAGMNWLSPILNDIGILARPALFNLYFAFASIPLGFVLAVFLALGKASSNGLVSRLSRGYIYAFRGSPFFIQLFMLYSLALAFNVSLWKPMGIDWLVLHPLFLGPAILTLNTTAYSAEIFHGALNTVPRGEIEAARAYGMSPVQQFRHVVWPHLIRIAWPAYTNEVVFLFHATALVYFTLPVIDEQKDLMNKSSELFERDYNAFLHFSVAALYFLTISLAIFLVFGLIYRRLMRHLPQPPRLRFTSRWLG